MKKFFEKHDLFKIVSIAFLLALILTWIIPMGSFSAGTYVEGEITRINLNQVFMSGIYSVNFFVLQFLFLIMLGAFYALLSKVKGYRALVSKIAKSVRGNETLFVLIISAIIAIIASVSTEIWHIILFAPFIITIILKAKMSKLTAFSATFGSILLGSLGATYSGFGLGALNGYLTTTYDTFLFVKFVILVVAFVLFNFFNIVNVNKTLKEKKTEDVVDPFEVEDEKKANIWPISILLILIAVVTLIGYFDWTTHFEIDFFTKIHDSILDFTIGDHAIFTYILGDYRISQMAILPIGYWDLLMVSVIMLLSMFIIKFIGGIKFDDAVEAIGDGIKKMIKPMLMVFMINCFFMFVYWSNFTVTIANWMMGLASGFNVFLMTLTGLVMSIFHVDFAYSGYLLGSWLVTSFPDAKNIIMLILNGTNGIIQLFVPTSLVLMLGLSYLDIKYKDWFKYIWKFILGMLLVLLLLFIILN